MGSDGAFVSIGPTDWRDPTTPKSVRWIPEGTDVHGWTPFVVAHPGCFASDQGQDVLDKLIREAGRINP